jgi:tRNA ligase
MIADRNNHQRRERKQIIEDVSKIVPNARFVALQYVHERGNYDNIRRATRDRIMARGDNHQTIHASTKGHEIIEIMEGFMHRFEPLSADTSPDDGFDTIINLDVLSSSRENLETVITTLYNEYPKLFRDQEMPTSADMDAAIAAALNNYTVEIKHEIKGGSTNNWQKKTQPNGAPNPSHTAPKPKERKIEYYAVQLPATRVAAVLDAVFRDASPEQAQMYNTLRASGRVQHDFHVTLIHRASAGQHPDIWAHLNDAYTRAAAPTLERAYSNPDAKLGLANVRLERLVWDKRVMAFVVRLAGSQGETWPCANRTAHITVGTSSPAVKPKESNDLLEKWLSEGSGGANGIMEVAVKGSVELEGVVKGVLGR